MILQDYMDIGYGYDSEDSFVDDSEAVCDCIVQMYCRIQQIFRRGKFLWFSHFFTQPRMFSVESFTRLDISLLKEAATTKVFPVNVHFCSNRESFPP